MKRDLLEQIIRKAIFEQNGNDVPVTKKIPVKISTLIGSDKSDYVAAGAIYGFDVVRTVVKKQRGQRASESTMFAAINDVLKNTPVLPIYDVVNREGLLALISGDFKPSARILSFRCWIFEDAYILNKIRMVWSDSIIQKNIGISGNKWSYDYGDIGFSAFDLPGKTNYYIGKAPVEKFVNGLQYDGQKLIEMGLSQSDVNPTKLIEYQAWYESLRKLNKTLPSEDFKITNIKNLPLTNPITDNAKMYVEEIPQFTITIDGEEFSLPEKLENEELQIRRHIGGTDKTTKTFLFSGDLVKTSDKVDYIGTATDAETANPVFVGSIRLIGKNSTTNELEYAFLDGTLTNYAMWKDDADSPTFQTYVITGEVKNGKILDEAKIIDSTNPDRSSTWAKYLESRKK